MKSNHNCQHILKSWVQYLFYANICGYIPYIFYLVLEQCRQVWRTFKSYHKHQSAFRISFVMHFFSESVLNLAYLTEYWTQWIALAIPPTNILFIFCWKHSELKINVHLSGPDIYMYVICTLHMPMNLFDHWL